MTREEKEAAFAVRLAADDVGGVYRDTLAMARRDLAAVEQLRAQAQAQVDAADVEVWKYARVILALSQQLGEEPPPEALAVFGAKTRKPWTRRQPTTSSSALK